MIVTRNVWLVHAEFRLTHGSRKDGRPLPHKSRKDPAVITRWEKALRTWQWWALWLPPVSEYVRGYFRNFAGSSSISGTSWRKLP